MSPCHWTARRSASPTNTTLAIPVEHTLYQQVVVTKIMPMSNATNMTDAERGMVKQWFEAGAKVD